MDKIEIRKRLCRYINESHQRSKPSKCIICGKSITALCNSHSIPQFVLRNLTKDGKVINAALALDLNIVNQEDGIKRSGTFSLICRECDNRVFSHYEDENALLQTPNNIIMAEIAMKNSLQQISKRNVEIELYALLQEETKRIEGKETLDTIQGLDIRDYLFDYRRSKKIIDKGLKSGYILLFSTLLPYVVPIAAQTGITLVHDLQGNIVNDIFDMSSNIRMQSLHCCIFPLQNSTRIALFHHKDDRNYVHFDKQFERLNIEEQLKYINYILFQYSENYFASIEIKEELLHNDNLKKLCRENYGMPNLGFVEMPNIFEQYTTVSIEDIPNFLHEKYKIA